MLDHWKVFSYWGDSKISVLFLQTTPSGSICYSTVVLFKLLFFDQPAGGVRMFCTSSLPLLQPWLHLHKHLSPKISFYRDSAFAHSSISQSWRYLSLEELVKMQILIEWNGPRFSNFTKLSGDADGVVSGPHFEQKGCRPMLSNRAATSCTWLLSSWNAASLNRDLP